jgi:hypothetical protein
MENKEGAEPFVQIINDSKKKLLVLQLLSNFFNHSHLVAILIRTKIIHNIFEGNKNLDINKLDLFHLQYTNSLIELFQKLKKSKEQNYLLICDEININKDFIIKLKDEVEENAGPFIEEVRNRSKNMSLKIEELYKQFESGSRGKFSWNEIIEFSNERSAEFYRDITEEQYRQLTDHETKKTYSNDQATFEKKLLGKLNIQKFKVKFLCGLSFGDELVEVYEFFSSNDMFIFINNKRAFYLIENSNIRGINISKNESGKKEILDQLINKNLRLEEKAGAVKHHIANDIEKVMESYLGKISSVDFLDDLQNVDEQTNILKAMLNINIK